MAGSGPVGINGLPKASPTEYEENGRLYSNFRRYVTLVPAPGAPLPSLLSLPFDTLLMV